MTFQTWGSFRLSDNMAHTMTRNHRMDILCCPIVVMNAHGTIYICKEYYNTI